MPFRRTLLTLLAVLALSLGGAGRAEALNIRDIIELTKAGLSDQVLIALIEVDRGVFSVDTDTLKKLKNAGVSDPVIVAMIRSGRMPAVEPPPAPVQNTDPAPADETSREPQVIVIDHHDQQPAAPQLMYPVGYVVPGLYPGYARPGFVSTTNSGAGITGFGNTGFNNPSVNNGGSSGYGGSIGFNGFGNNVIVATPRRNQSSVTTVVPTDQGLVKAKVPLPVNCVKAEPVYWGFGGKLRPGSWQPPPTVLCR